MARPPARVKTAPAPAASGPPPARRAVVVRAGPPPAKRDWKGVAAGVLGVLLLVAAAVMTVALPEETVLPPQFKVSFPTERTDLPEQSFDFSLDGTEQAQRHSFEFNITHDNVVQVALNVHFTDDLAASDPDTFRIELVDPDGNTQPPSLTVSNPRPRRNETDPTRFDAGIGGGTYFFNLGQAPEDLVFDGAFNDTEESVARAQEREHRFNTQGAWRVRVFLVAAGGCPTPAPANPDPDEAVRSAACLQANRDQPDPRLDAGNPFTVGSFSYTRFTVSAERLD